MKAHHKWMHCAETTKKYNLCASYIDAAIAYCKDKTPDGATLNETLANLKTYIASTLNLIPGEYANIKNFISKFESYDLTEFTNKSVADILGDESKVTTFIQDTTTSIQSAGINTKTKLAAINVTNPLLYAAPILMEPPLQYICIHNDFLDAAAYVLKGINPDNGTVLTMTDDEKKARVRSYLNQWNRFEWDWPVAYQDEVTLMANVKDWVSGHLDNTPPADIATYIEANIVKLPLIRRMW